MFYYIYSMPKKYNKTICFKSYRLEVLTFMHGKIAEFHTEKNHKK